MTRQVAAAIAIVVFACLAVSPALAATNPAGSALATPDGFSQTVFTIHVSDDGTAQWTFEHSQPLENDTEREEFRTFAEDFEANESEMYRDFVERAGRLTAAGSSVTDRQMNATNFERAAGVDDLSEAKGTVELSFDWENFGVVEDETVRIGDVFEGGIYIGEDQRLVVKPGSSLVMTEAEPTPDRQPGASLRTSDSVTWIGERQFADQRPTVTFTHESAVTESNPNSSDENGTPGPTNQSNGDMLVLVGVLVVVAGLVGAAVWQSGALTRRRGVANDSAAEAAGAAADPGDAGNEPAGISDEELLSDNDRVLKLLEENGGRMKQVNIVDETEWSKSKVSMLLSDMEDDGEISKLRVGRENIISLTGHEPDAAGSPFDDEE